MKEFGEEACQGIGAANTAPDSTPEESEKLLDAAREMVEHIKE